MGRHELLGLEVSGRTTRPSSCAFLAAFADQLD